MRTKVVFCCAVFIGLIIAGWITACPPGVTDLVCTEEPGGVQLTWTNNDNGTYTFIEIVRDDVTIADLPADATGYFDPTPVTDLTVYIVYAHDGAAPTGAACVLGGDPMTLETPDITAATGQTIDIPFILGTPFENYGFSFGYEHDPAKVTFLQAVQGATTQVMNDGDGADFFGLSVETGSPTGFTCGCVYSFFSTEQIPPGEDFELVVASYSVDAQGPDTTELDFTAQLGNPPVGIVVVALPQFIPLVPETEGTTLTIVEPGGEFLRGDTNDDGTVGLPDVMVTLSAMFQGGPLMCPAAADTDDDMQLLLIDPILCLMFLYQSGPPPAAPFPDCGSDPQNMGCDQYLSCP